MWVLTGSGITSRCGVLADAYYMVKYRKIGKKLTIIWPVSKECKISYYDVFDDTQFADIPHRVIELRRGAVISEKEESFIGKGGVKYYISERNMRGAFYALYIEMKMILSHIGLELVRRRFKRKNSYHDYTPSKEVGWAGEAYLKHIEQTRQNIIKDLKAGKDMYVYAGSGIIPNEEKDQGVIAGIKFREEYWNAAEKILHGNRNIVGIHIRRTDHNVAIAGSKTEDFFRYIDKILEEDPATMFFLATDDEREENILREKYGEKIITMGDKSWGRDSSSGMKCGIIDMLCLSSCKFILGSCGSVYSRFAAEYGKIDLVICKENEESFA